MHDALRLSHCQSLLPPGKRLALHMPAAVSQDIVFGIWGCCKLRYAGRLWICCMSEIRQASSLCRPFPGRV